MPIYLPAEIFDKLVKRIANLSPDPFERRITVNQIRRQLEDVAGILPEPASRGHNAKG